MVWDHFSKTDRSLPLVMGFERATYQIKGDIVLYNFVENRIGMNLD